MNDEPSLYEKIRRIQAKLEERYKEQGIEIEYRENWQEDKDGNKDKEMFFKRNGEWFSSSACIKLALAMQLPESGFKHVKKRLNKNKVEL